MIRRTFLFALMIVLSGCMGLAQIEEMGRSDTSGSIEWRESFGSAVESAHSQNKPLMLVFYGVSSKRLDENVFSAPEVIELAQKFVCLKVGTAQTELIQRYGVQEFPTIIFANSRGGEYDRVVGYKSREGFVGRLKTALVPLDAEYDLQIEPSRPGKAMVKCIFRNVRQNSLVLSLVEKHDMLYDISYDSTDGRPGWEELEKDVWHIKFNTSAMKTVTVQYRVGLNIPSSMDYHPTYISYVGESGGILDGHALFMSPQDLHLTGKVRIRLNLPPGWNVITPWKEDISLSPPQKDTGMGYLADSLEEVTDSVFCIGQFHVAKRQIDGKEIYAVFSGAKKDMPDLERKADVIAQIFKDYIVRFGDFPFEKYLAIFAGPTPDGRYIHGSAHSLGFAGPVNVDYSFIAHEIFHVWNGGVINQKSEYEAWFKEGFTQYYGYLTPYRIGLYSKERFVQSLRSDYEEYLKKYGSGEDIALTKVKEGLARKEGHEQPESIKTWVMYIKSALVASLLNDEIGKRTGGEKNLDDLMRYMFSEFQEGRYSSEDILKSLNTVTGQDFTQFFSDFVYGKAKLPPELISSVP